MTSPDDAMETDDDMACSEEGSITNHQCENSEPYLENFSSYAETAKTWLTGLKWNPYPPLLHETKAFDNVDDEYSIDIDPAYGIRDLFSDCKVSTSVAGSHASGLTIRSQSPLLQSDFDYRELIFSMLQKYASNRRSFVGPLTEQAFNALTNFSSSLIDDALSGEDERIHHAVTQLIGNLSSGDILVGEVIDERKWDISDEIAVNCVDSIIARVAQDVDFYSPAPGVDRADPVFSMILAETDWLLYEMVCFVSDEEADTSLYDDHFFGPSEEERKKRKVLELKMKIEQEKKAVKSFLPLAPEILPTLLPKLPDHHFGYNYIAPPPVEGLDPNSTAYWQAYYESQQQAAFVQAAAYSYSAKQHAQMIVAQAQAYSGYQYQQPAEANQQYALSTQKQPQPLPKAKSSMAVKFMQSALKSKSAATAAALNSAPVVPPAGINKTSTSTPELAKREEKEAKDRKDSPKDSRDNKGRKDEKHSSLKRRSDNDGERQEGPVYCMVTNLRSDSRASEVERAAEKYGRVDSVKVLRDKTAKPPDNGLASITFRYVFKASFDKLLSNGLNFNGKYRPIARLQSDPFASS